MELNEIIEGLGKRPFPFAAVEAARQRRQELTPLLVQEFERLAKAPGAAPHAALENGDNPLFLMFHLLGEWGERAAYRPLARFLRGADDFGRSLLGDALTETSHRVMASVYDDDPQVLFDIVFDSGADEYIRERMCDTVAMLTEAGRIEREVATGFFRECFNRFEPEGASHVWVGWQRAIAHLGLTELVPLVEEAWKRKQFRTLEMELKHFHKTLERTAAARGAWARERRYTPFTAVDELASWHAFAEDHSHCCGGAHHASEHEHAAPYTNPHKDVGRNDPCVCGSGKKFKKCCLKVLQAEA